MKTIQVTLTLVAIFFLTLLTVGAETMTNLPYGSESDLMEYCATNTTIVEIIIYQQLSNGTPYTAGKWISDQYRFASADELQSFFVQQLKLVAQSAILSTNVNLKRDMPFTIQAIASRYDKTNFVELLYLCNVGNFTLLPSQNLANTWELPDLSGRRLIFADYIPFHYENLEWVRVEGYTKDWSQLTYEDDSRYDPGENLFPEYEYFQIPTDLLLSGTNGPSRLKVYTVTGTNDLYQIFGPTGNPFPRKPSWLDSLTKTYVKDQQESGKFTMTFNGLSTSILGGDPGVQVTLQSSADLIHWSDIGQILEVSDFGTPIPVTMTNISGTSGFLRVRVVPGIPF